VRVLTVDLGTSNTAAVLSVHGRHPRVIEVDGSATMPSAVFAAEDGTILVGRDAERRARLDPSRFEPNPKRRIDDGTLLLGTSVVPVNEVLAAVLRRVFDETCRQLGGAPPDQIRLTHPARWGETRRNSLLSAARLAGIGGELVLVPEPVAAAAHFASLPGHALAPGQSLAVYDLGAGTFDVAVLDVTRAGYTVLAENGLPDLGGLDMDQALLEYVGREVSHRDAARWQRLLRPESTADRRARRSLWEDVRAAKETLSRHPQTEVPMPEPFDDVLVTRGELEALIRPSVLRSVELLGDTVRTAGTAPDKLAGIYLVGGASRIPLVATLIADRLRLVPVSLDQPETAVALGACHMPHDDAAEQTQQFVLTGPWSAPVQAQSSARPTSPTHSGPQYLNTDEFLANAHFPNTTTPDKRTEDKAPRRKRLYTKKTMGLAATAVIAIVLAVGGFALFRGTLFTPGDCRQPGSVDAKGLTSCMRPLAEPVAGKGDCHAGYDGSATGLAGLTGTSATCQLGGDDASHTVVYTQTGSVDDIAPKVKALLDGYGTSRQVQANWAGNGLSGTYHALAASGVGVVVFTVSDRPLVGVLTIAVSSTPNSLTAATVADYFERTVQPGTGAA